jgi:phosphotransferase system HPr (HPr) family protein
MAVERKVVIENTWGLHVRPATAMAELASKFSCSLQVVKDGRGVDAKSPIALLTLAAVCGSELTIRADGPDAEKAAEAMAALVARRFDMDKEPDVAGGNP